MEVMDLSGIGDVVARFLGWLKTKVGKKCGVCDEYYFWMGAKLKAKTLSGEITVKMCSDCSDIFDRMRKEAYARAAFRERQERHLKHIGGPSSEEGGRNS